MAKKMLVVITDTKKLRKWPWSEQRYRVKFLLHGRQPFELKIKESEGYDRFFKRVYGKIPILRFGSRVRSRKKKRRRVR